MTSVVAALEGVTKRFGPVTALDDVSLQIERDSTTALLGPNGAGKSTLAALLLGLRRPDCGSVLLLGRDPRDHRARRLLGAAPQEVAFPQLLTVREVLALVGAHFDHTSADDIVSVFGLSRLLRRQTGGLSGGQRRRLAVALAFVGRPRLVVLDEPTAGLDGEGRRAVWDSVRAARGAGAAVLFATHELDEAEAVATRVVALDQGRPVADGTAAAVKSRAGLTRIRFRAASPPRMRPEPRWQDGWVELDTVDAGATVADLVAAGIPLLDLEVRPLTLREALDVLREESA